ncbi:MAG: FtsK/SpoIIIE domain-containing protein [Actinomycetota bacterium]|nr:FtsK/SpoIIIE domain-containing protein [Actinomycetota bacterium]
MTSRRGHLPFARVAGIARGWSLEVGLGVGAVACARLGDGLLGPGGDVLVLVLVLLALAWRPGPRGRLAALLAERSTRRWIAKALRQGSVEGVLGAPPRVVASRRVAVGHHLRVQLPPGFHAGHLERDHGSLASRLRVREVRVLRDPHDASLAELVVVTRDVLADRAPLAWPWAGARQVSLWDPVPLGVSEDGTPVTLPLVEHNLLLGGEPGAGKSVALSLLVAAAALDANVSLRLLDGKQVELAPFATCAEHFVGPDIEAAVEALEEIRSDMDARYDALLAAGRRKVARSDGLSLRVVAVDELAYFLRHPDRSPRVAFEAALRDLVARGRAAGVVVLAATQKPSHDLVPTSIRDLFSYRLALRCTTNEASDTILGQGWATKGFSAATIDARQRGVGFLLSEGALPVRCKAAYLDDAAIAAIARRGAAARAGAAEGSGAGADAGAGAGAGEEGKEDGEGPAGGDSGGRP